jgi:exodeoxyribonuclease-3
VAARLENGVVIHNFYVPAGGDVPDRAVNDKFGQKLDYPDRDAGLVPGADRPEKAILVGDLNIAPREDDVWSHKQLLKVVSHTPVEVEHLGEMQEAGGWVDITRKDIPEGCSIQWWSYRSPDWEAADKGRRLDHVWATPDIANARAMGRASCATRAAGRNRRTTRRSSPASISDLGRAAHGARSLRAGRARGVRPARGNGSGTGPVMRRCEGAAT